jgi:hypothetical protein
MNSRIRVPRRKLRTLRERTLRVRRTRPTEIVRIVSAETTSECRIAESCRTPLQASARVHAFRRRLA